MSASAVHFSKFLAGQGDIGSLFSRFLLGRADLFSSACLSRLEELPFRSPPMNREAFVRTLSSELSGNGELLARQLDRLPCWSVPGRCAYRTVYGDSPLVLQIARPLPPRSSMEEFAVDLRRSVPDEVEAVTEPRVLRQFEEWLAVTDAPGRERGFLEVLSEMCRATLADYPVLLPEFSTDRVLCWNWVEGDPLPTPLSAAAQDVRQRMAEALLEQISSLSFVDSELDTDAMALSPKGRLIFRRISRPLAVPVGRTQAVLRYIADTLSENSAGGAHWLLELAGQSRSPQSVSRLLAATAVVQPQLIRKENVPPFVRAFEGNWRAIRSMELEAPLYLHFLHRNLIAAGNCGTNQVTELTAPDFMQEAQAVVLGTMVRNSAGDILEPALAREWAAGAGMVMVEGLKVIGRIAGDLRDGTNSQRAETAVGENGAAFRSRCVRSGVITGVLLVAFLVCLRASVVLHETWWSWALALAAAASGVAVFWSVSRIG